MNRKTKSIIERLYKSKEFNCLFDNLNPNEFIEDLKAEVILILCEMEDSKVLKLFNDGALLYYTKKIAHYSLSEHGTVRAKYMPKKALLPPLHIPSIEEKEERRNDERLQDALMNLFPLLHSQDSEAISIYLRHGSFRKASEVCGIPYSTLCKRFHRARRIIIAVGCRRLDFMPREKSKDRRLFYKKFNRKVFNQCV